MIFFYLLVAIMPLYTHPFWAQAIGESGQMSVFKLVGAVCVIYAIVYLAYREEFPVFFETWQLRLFGGLYVLVLCSFVTKGSGAFYNGSMMAFTSFALFLFVVLTVVDTAVRLRWLLATVVGSVALASLYVIREWQKYHSVYARFRPGSVVGDANYFAISAIICFPVAFHFMLNDHSRLWRTYWAGCLGVILVAATLGASRGGFLGLIVAGLWLVWRTKRRLRNLALAVALVAPLVLLAPMSPMRRFLEPSYGDQVSSNARLVAWRAGLRMIQQYPLTGIGIGNFRALVMSFEDQSDDQITSMAHNTYLEFAAELGVPGLLLFLGILLSTISTFRKQQREAGRLGLPLFHGAALGLEAGLVGCGVGIFFLSAAIHKLLWLVVFTSACLPPVLADHFTQLHSSSTHADDTATAPPPALLQ